MSTVTFPDGSQFASTALTRAQIQTLFQVVTIQILGLVNDPTAPQKVRVGWQLQGQPGQPIDTDTTVVRCETIDTEYSRMRDVVGTASADLITNTDIYTRAWKTTWTFYGPNSLDQARLVRSALTKIQFVTDYLANSNVYGNPSIREPISIPENFQGQWWERADLEAEFNEQVTETSTVGFVKSVEVEVFTKDGQIADFVVTEP